MARAFLVVMDSVGIGGAPDAGRYFNKDLPDLGANTVAHIAQACAEGRAEEGRSGPLRLPTLDALGLGAAVQLASNQPAPGLDAKPTGLWGAASEVSAGKDTPSGHWELAGLPVPWDWSYFSEDGAAFDKELVAHVAEAAGTTGILGNCHASGTTIIADLGAEHMKTGLPICYTSADSVFQIAAHEECFGLERLLKLCADVAPYLHARKVGRVIARPFVGTPEEGFSRTTNRRDFAIRPPAPILTDWVRASGGRVHGIGKIGDIFSMQGIDTLEKGSDAALMEHLSEAVQQAEEGSLTFANFVEFDSLYGHRRDISGYARALEWFDREIARVLDQLRDGDLMILTADHGNDPSWPGTDHTREQVPVLVAGAGTGTIGAVQFADVAASVAAHLDVPSQGPGRSFLP
ncbi:phosphopentomutase [Tritonibacter mobilis]|uniref:phosphopentomutase n=1 Tax=Tritonibacter mobilis TaxID=379347 RepID=UPI0008069D23|nr:phosphopentomutase [Tritonibacter mobilis]GLP85291.1 phosphopentomutase [Tritonibacter mobilis]SDW78084.1 phosphopentomutase [Tritonibacter mobilis]